MLEAKYWRRKGEAQFVVERTAIDLTILAAAKVHGRTSRLALWLNDRMDQLAAVGRIGNWQPICDLAAADGVTDANGRPLTPPVVSRAWSRLRARQKHVRQPAERSQPLSAGK